MSDGHQLAQEEGERLVADQREVHGAEADLHVLDDPLNKLGSFVFGKFLSECWVRVDVVGHRDEHVVVPEIALQTHYLVLLFVRAPFVQHVRLLSLQPLNLLRGP